MSDATIRFRIGGADYQKLVRQASVSGWPMERFLEMHLAALLKLDEVPHVKIEARENGATNQSGRDRPDQTI